MPGRPTCNSGCYYYDYKISNNNEGEKKIFGKRDTRYQV